MGLSSESVGTFSTPIGVVSRLVSVVSPLDVAVAQSDGGRWLDVRGAAATARRTGRDRCGQSGTAMSPDEVRPDGPSLQRVCPIGSAEAQAIRLQRQSDPAGAAQVILV